MNFKLKLIDPRPTEFEKLCERFEEAYAKLDDLGYGFDPILSAMNDVYEDCSQEQLLNWVNKIEKILSDKEDKITNQENQEFVGLSYDLEYYGDEIVRHY